MKFCGVGMFLWWLKKCGWWWGECGELFSRLLVGLLAAGRDDVTEGTEMGE